MNITAMSSVIPDRILNYPITAASPTEELLTLGHIYSDMGSYASTILDREHLALSRKCAVRLDKVVKQLLERGRILSAENLREMPVEVIEGGDLSAMTIGELYDLYRCWPARHRKREAEGRDHMTFYYEGRIIRELRRRKASDKGERLKIDYCELTYRNELETISFILSLPIGAEYMKYPHCDRNPVYRGCDYDLIWRKGQDDLAFPQTGKIYTPTELIALIGLYSSYSNVVERELLIEYVDLALDLMEASVEKVPLMGLASEIVELRRKRLITVPGWVSTFLEEAIEEARSLNQVEVSGVATQVKESEIIVPFLTLQMLNGSSKLEREAARLINRCYRRSAGPECNIDDLYMAVTCCDYVSRFSVRKMGKSWDEVSSRVIRTMSDCSTDPSDLAAERMDLSTQGLVRLLTVANEIETYTNISVENKNILLEELEKRALLSRDVEAKAYLMTLPVPVAAAV